MIGWDFTRLELRLRFESISYIPITAAACGYIHDVIMKTSCIIYWADIKSVTGDFISAKYISHMGSYIMCLYNKDAKPLILVLYVWYMTPYIHLSTTYIHSIIYTTPLMSTINMKLIWICMHIRLSTSIRLSCEIGVCAFNSCCRNRTKLQTASYIVMTESTAVIVRCAVLSWSHEDPEMWWSVPLRCTWLFMSVL